MPEQGSSEMGALQLTIFLVKEKIFSKFSYIIILDLENMSREPRVYAPLIGPIVGNQTNLGSNLELII